MEKKETLEMHLNDAGEIIIDKAKAVSAALDEKPLVDRVLGKAVSRKFLTFTVATGLMLYSNLDSETWGMIAMIYIGSQSVIDACLAWKHGRG